MINSQTRFMRSVRGDHSPPSEMTTLQQLVQKYNFYSLNIVIFFLFVKYLSITNNLVSMMNINII